jgi:phenylacetate-CoA ligase
LAVLDGFVCRQCGRHTQIWRSIEGRMQEFAITGNGRPISMTAINMHDGVFDDILQFQFHQREHGIIAFRYVPRRTCSHGSVANMHERLQFKFGPDMVVEMCPVDRIEPSKRGKQTFLVQELPITWETART